MTWKLCEDCLDWWATEGGRWCEDCFDKGLKKDMHDMSVQNIKNEMETDDETKQTE